MELGTRLACLSWLSWLLSAILLAGCGSPESRVAELRTSLAGANLLLVTVDSMAAAHTSPYGYERDTTPTLSRLAAESIRFADVTAGSPNGFASIATLFSGEALGFCRVDQPGEIWPADRTVLAQAFRSAGYRTHGISTHAAVCAELGHNRGFDSFESVARTPGAGVPVAVHEFVDQILTGEEDAPFFAFVQLGTLLLPRNSQPDRAAELLGHVPDPQLGTPEVLNQMKSAGAAPARTLAALNLFDAVLHDVDFAIGRWLELLQRTPRERDTVLIVAGTCGQGLGQRGHFGAGGDVHQEQIAVPLLIRLPGGQFGGQVVRDPVALYDLYPTLADLFELNAPASRSGSSLALLMTGDWLERSQPVVSRTSGKRPRICLRQGHFKLMTKFGAPGRRGNTLQHLERDFLETRDYAPQRPETLADLERELRRFCEDAERVNSAPGSIEVPAELHMALEAIGYRPGSDPLECGAF